MTPNRYRKKPVVIEATQWDGTAEDAASVIDWILSHGETARYHEARSESLSPYRPGDLNVVHIPACIVIDTLEGHMTCSAGDFVIKGVADEFYPCKPEIFAATYESLLKLL